MRHTSTAVTIRDVARQARVGLGTVSRVLNGAAHVSLLTRRRVLAAIRRLGFRPHAPARRILRRRAEMVCFLLSNRDFLHSFHAGILQGVENYARAERQHVVFGVVHYGEMTPSSRISLPRLLEERGWVDGLILAGTIYPNFLRRIQGMRIPFVAVGNNVVGLNGRGRFDQVRFDSEAGEFEATRFVIEQGHRRIAFVADVTYPWFGSRHQGYLRAIRANKLEPISLIDPQEQLDYIEYGERAATRVLALAPRPTGVLTGNDEIAYGLWRSFQRIGIRIPREISLVGFDDQQEAQLNDPPLTTVRVHREEIGRLCMKLLLERLHRPKRPFAEHVLPTELVVRESVSSVDSGPHRLDVSGAAVPTKYLTRRSPLR